MQELKSLIKFIL